MTQHLPKVVYMSVLCMLFTAISNANLGIISQFASQNGNKWVGPLSVAFIFLGSGTGALYHGYIHKWSYKRIIFTGAIGWDFFVSFSVVFLFIGFSQWVIAIILIGSLLCGFTVSIYYNGINNYVSDCGKKDVCIQKYFGINTCIIQASNIVGNGLSAVLIEPLGQKLYSFVMLGLVILFSIAFLTLKQVQKNQEHKSLIDESIISEQSKQPLKKQQNKQIQKINQTKNVPKLLYFCFAMSGVMISFIFSQLSIVYYRQFPDLNQQALNKMTFLTFMIEGCGQFVGGFFLALFAQKIASLSMAYIINGILFLLSVGTLFYAFTNQIEWLINLGAFGAGFADCFCFAVALSIAGKWQDQGISLFNFGQSSTVAIFCTLYIWLDLEWSLFLYGAYLLMATIIVIAYRSVLDSYDKKQT